MGGRRSWRTPGIRRGTAACLFIIRFVPEKSREAGKKWTFRLYPGYVEKICGKVHKFRRESSTYSTMEFEKMVIAFLGAWC